MMTPNVHRLMCECGVYYLPPGNCCSFCAEDTEARAAYVAVVAERKRLDPEERKRRKAAKVEEWREANRERYLEKKRQWQKRTYWARKAAK